MIEKTLYNAAQKLPVPQSDFAQIVKSAYSQAERSGSHFRRYHRAAAILACVLLLLGGTVAAASTTEVDYSAWATHADDFGVVKNIADALGVTLPETLNNSPFYHITTMYVVPDGTTYLEALNTPVYKWYAVDYGIEALVRQYDSDAPDSGYEESTVVYDKYSVSFGSTDDPLFRYVFSLDETGIRVSENALPGSYRAENYNGVDMQMVTDVQSDREKNNDIFAYHHRVIWVDDTHQTIFLIHKSFYAEEDGADQFPVELTEIAKQIIDSNTSS